MARKIIVNTRFFASYEGLQALLADNFIIA
jgi:hypothetical protein